MERDKFDESIEKELLKNGFANYSDWEYGPQSSLDISQDHYGLSLFKHDYGYWLIISQHASGKNLKMNIGSSNSAKDIIEIRNALNKLW